MGSNWDGMLSAFGDAIWEFGGGKRTTDVTVAAAAGATSLTVTSTDAFPDAGVIGVDRTTYRYTGRSATVFTGLTVWAGPQATGAAGLVAPARPGAAVLDLSLATTQLDALRGEFFLLRADAALDTFGANFGWYRPPDVDAETWRALLQWLIASPTQTLPVLAGVLEILHPGPGEFEIWHNPIAEDQRWQVFVRISDPNAGDPTGKAFLLGTEALARTSPTTVTPTIGPAVVTGIFADTDPLGVGRNYAFALLTGATTIAGDQIEDAVNSPFGVGDVGAAMTLTMPSGAVQLWHVAAFIDATRVALATLTRADGQISGGSARFRSQAGWFAPWVGVGGAEAVELVITSGAAAGAYPVTRYLSAYEIEVALPFPTTQADATWFLRPQWAGGATISEHQLYAATATAGVISVPDTLPAQVLVESSAVPSAQLLTDAFENGTVAAPFYLYEYGAGARAILSEICAAGVTVHLEVS